MRIAAHTFLVVAALAILTASGALHARTLADSTIVLVAIDTVPCSAGLGHKMILSESFGRVYDAVACGEMLVVRAYDTNLTLLWTANPPGVNVGAIGSLAVDSLGYLWVALLSRDLRATRFVGITPGGHAEMIIERQGSGRDSYRPHAAVDREGNLLFAHVDASDGYVAKLEKALRSVWRNSIMFNVTDGWNGVCGMHVNADRSITMAGARKTSAASRLDGYVVRYNADASERWLREFSGSAQTEAAVERFFGVADGSCAIIVGEYVAGVGTHRVARLDADGNVRFAVPITLPPAPDLTEVIMDRDSNVAVLLTDYRDAQTLTSYDRHGSVRWRNDGDPGGAFAGITAMRVMTIDTAGNLYFAGTNDSGSFRLVRIDADGTKRWDFTSVRRGNERIGETNDPHSVAVSSGGSVYVGSSWRLNSTSSVPLATLTKFRQNVPMASGVNDETATTGAGISLSIEGANPVRERTTASVTNDSRTSARLELYDTRGALRATIHDRAEPETARRVVLDVRELGLEPGVYFLRLRAAGETRSVPLIVAP